MRLCVQAFLHYDRDVVDLSPVVSNEIVNRSKQTASEVETIIGDSVVSSSNRLTLQLAIYCFWLRVCVFVTLCVCQRD